MTMKLPLKRKKPEELERERQSAYRVVRGPIPLPTHINPDPEGSDDEGEYTPTDADYAEYSDDATDPGQPSSARNPTG